MVGAARGCAHTSSGWARAGHPPCFEPLDLVSLAEVVRHAVAEAEHGAESTEVRGALLHVMHAHAGYSCSL